MFKRAGGHSGSNRNNNELINISERLAPYVEPDLDPDWQDGSPSVANDVAGAHDATPASLHMAR